MWHLLKSILLLDLAGPLGGNVPRINSQEMNGFSKKMLRAGRLSKRTLGRGPGAR